MQFFQPLPTIDAESRMISRIRCDSRAWRQARKSGPKGPSGDAQLVLNRSPCVPEGHDHVGCGVGFNAKLESPIGCNGEHRLKQGGSLGAKLRGS